MNISQIIEQANRSYSLSGFSGVCELYCGLTPGDQLTAREFFRRYPTSPMDEKARRFGVAFLQYLNKPVGTDKYL